MRRFKIPAVIALTVLSAFLLVPKGLSGVESIPDGGATPTPTAAPAATPCSFSQNFDGLTAPVLPTGWVAFNAQGAAPLWVTSTTTPDTAPNDAFVDDPAVVTDKLLDTSGIAITTAAAQVVFRNFYNLESGFDGGVLEVSSPNIAAGAFTDITNAAVGGSFVTGGYNAIISTSFGSPIAARLAWSGNSGGYINTVANLGPNVVGQTIKLRFRMATDVSVSATGWRVDTVSVTGVACPPCGELGSWATVANYPVGIQVPALGTDGTFIYSAAGFAGGATNAFYRYDPVANNWTTLASMPASLWFGGGVYAANTNSFYVFGGFNGTMLNTTYRYNVASNTWSTGAVMPSGRYDSNVVYYAATGKIYVVGGFDDGIEVNQTWEYDPVANTWNTSRANIPVVMAGSGTSIAGQFIYLAGTWGGGTGSTTHYRYDIVANTWTLMAPVPVAMSHPATGVVDGRIYVIGGGNAFRPAPGLETGPLGMRGAAPDVSYNSTYIYDIAGNSWTSGPNTNLARVYAEGAAIGNRLLVVGGYDSATDTDTNTVETNVVGACPCPASRVLIVYADGAAPTSLPAALAAEPGIASVTLFNGQTGTPTLAQLQQYDIVVPWSNTPWLDQTTLGNNLGSYLAGGGTVVAFNFDWFGSTQAILGTWETTYTPFNNPGANNFNASTLGTCTFAPLCSGVSTLNAFYRMTMTLASGATLAATWNDGTPLIAYKGRAIGVSAYVGDSPNSYSGQFSRLIANAGVWLTPPCAPPTPTPTPPATVSISGRAFNCASPAPTATPTPAGPTATPAATPPVPGVTMTLTGTSGGSTTTDGAGNYSFSGLTSGGNYTITPTKGPLPAGTGSINTQDVLATQRHALGITLIPAGCRLTAADAVVSGTINTQDVLAIQRFSIGFTSGIGSAGQYKFTPANYSFVGLGTNQANRDFAMYVIGDCAAGFVNRDGTFIDADLEVRQPGSPASGSTSLYAAGAK